MTFVSMTDIGQRAKAAGKQLARVDHRAKERRADRDWPMACCNCADDILAANAIDVANAKARNVEAYFVDRLTLNPQRLQTIATDVRNVAALPDPVGEQFDATTLPNGLRLHKRRIPLGVLGVIYEAAPTSPSTSPRWPSRAATPSSCAAAATPCHSNKALLSVVHAAMKAHGLPLDAVQLVEDPDRARILEMLRLNDSVDLIIPRGGAALHKLCRDNSNIPVITGGMGINHIYVDESADQAKASRLFLTPRPANPPCATRLARCWCIADIAAEFLPKMAARSGREASGIAL